MVDLRRDAVRVVVPATSANVGPAFDSAGLALAIYDELTAMVTDDDGILIEIAGEGEGSLPVDESHLVVRSMLAAFARMDAAVPGLILRCANSIPHGRGLGSSAAAIIGGMVLARALVADGRERMTDTDVLQLALRQESHPDNLAAALHGGFTIAWMEDDGFADAVRMEPHRDVHPVVIIPPTQLPTTAARALLPSDVPLSDASHNVSRAALLVHAMTHDPRRLMAATSDRLHQQCRSSAYPDSVALVGRLREAGVPAVISGAGPTVLAFAGAQELALVESASGTGWRVLPVDPSVHGAREVPVPPLP